MVYVCARIQLCVRVVRCVVSGCARLCVKEKSFRILRTKLSAIMNGMVLLCCQACIMWPMQNESICSEMMVFCIMYLMCRFGYCVLCMIFVINYEYVRCVRVVGSKDVLVSVILSYDPYDLWAMG